MEGSLGFRDRGYIGAAAACGDETAGTELAGLGLHGPDMNPMGRCVELTSRKNPSTSSAAAAAAAAATRRSSSQAVAGGEEGEGEGAGHPRGPDDDSDVPCRGQLEDPDQRGVRAQIRAQQRREALHRLEEQKKKGLVADPDDDDDDESDEDEAVAAASRRVDRRVLQVIRRIRTGDSAIFDKDAKVYSSSSEDEDDDAEGEPKEGKKAKKERPLYLKDVNAQHLLEEGPEFAAQTGRGSKYDRIAYDERQREGLKEFLEAEKKALGDGDGEEDDDLFMAKQADGDGDDSQEDEDEKQTEELLGEVFGDDEKLDDNEKFLKNYILNRPYLEPVPDKFSLDDIQEVSEEEVEIERQEDYEETYNKVGKYNFRHEEVEASEGVVTDRVMGHPRVVEGSVRKKESSRKKQRKSKEERLARAKQEQAEELKHLKNLKKKEIAEKLEKIRMIAGIEGEAACKLGADDLEEDFDPEDYDRKMQEMFDENYYGADEVDPEFGSGDDLDLVKPDFDKEDELLGLPKDWSLDGKEGSTSTGEKKKKKKEKKNKELANGEEEGEKRKGKISLKDKVELEKELDEYYKLDYEDTIGDLKTRFKYRQVQPNSFGLETYEILQSDDRDLNQYLKVALWCCTMSTTESRRLSDDYEVTDVLGRGGFSIVRRGVSKSDEGKTQVAIKTLRRLGPAMMGMQQGSKAAPSSGGLPLWKQVSISDALLTNEILVMRRIVENVAPHPNVICLHDVYEDAHGVHLILELCSGGELFDRIIGRERYSEFDAAAVVRQIASGLKALHKANIIHRDLKPENCLFSDRKEDSTLKIMDFGLSSVEDFSDPVVALFGSVDYVSPEALSRQEVSTASDMWSVGVILYILLSGCPPFHAATNQEKQQRILQGEFSFQEHTWKTITSSAKDLISNRIDAEVVSKLQRFNARRKLRAAAIASVLSSKVALRTKRLRSLLGTHDLSSEELDNLRQHFARICADGENATLAEFEQVLKAMKMDSLIL
ncbi:hypothetical protein ZWY2020_014997 [Hordeum vulgare]|nr:hypothetical protein ZWY2020_014997 [Hordeum vulgare]